MKYIVNPLNIGKNGDCNGINFCNCNFLKDCSDKKEKPCKNFIPCGSKCDALCTSDCSGTDSVNSPSSFNF
ncbi:hypothetical protein [Neofamilia massiliensis]|uniref:hypothetical protein n=1 Tax=Neofamilia massiliensis TaxID=1673724 RepID=UPI0006BB79CD|nr:hypothetical protein [Neofamilia massiliensis]